MKTLKTLSLFILLTLVTTVAMTQPQRGNNRPADGILTAEVAEQLNLSDAQKGRILTLRQAQLARMQTIRDEFRSGDMTPNQFQELREERMVAHDEELKSVLSTEQYEKLLVIRQDRQSANREGRNMRQGNRQGAGGAGYQRNNSERGSGYMRNAGQGPNRGIPVDSMRQRRNQPQN